MQLELEDEGREPDFNALFASYEAEQGRRVKRFAKRITRVLFEEGRREFGGEFRMMGSWEAEFVLFLGKCSVSDDDCYDAEYLAAHAAEGGEAHEEAEADG